MTSRAGRTCDRVLSGLAAARRLGVIVGIGLALSGCTTLSRLGGPPALTALISPEGLPATVRFTGSDSVAFERLVQASFAKRGASPAPRRTQMLALSGGGANGAFGAGAIVGLGRRPDRPAFDIVTGVSTGALTAPFAFLGPAWDRPLEQAYTGGAANGLLKSRGLGVLFATGVFDDGPLRRLVETFVTREMLTAIAAETARGRLLLVVTSNLDTGEPVIWDMGAIASQHDAKALALFRDVLVASASVPGVFPPVMLPVRQDGGRYEEMHVDGSVTIPFFVLNQSPLFAKPPDEPDNADVYVVVNGALKPSSQATPRNVLAIANRSLMALMAQTVSSELLRISTLADIRGSSLRYTALPTDQRADPLDFDRESMRRLFAYGARCGTAGEIWRTVGSRGGDDAAASANGVAPPCPAASSNAALSP